MDFSFHFMRQLIFDFTTSNRNAIYTSKKNIVSAILNKKNESVYDVKNRIKEIRKEKK